MIVFRVYSGSKFGGFSVSRGNSHTGFQMTAASFLQGFLQGEDVMKQRSL